MLLKDVETYLRRTGMRPTRFGREAAGDPRLVFDLREGRCLGTRLEGRLRTYMGARS